MQKKIMVCLFASVAVFVRGDGDSFINNYSAQATAKKSELNYSGDVYQGAFQDGINNTSPDYQTAGASTFLDPNAPPPDPLLNDGQIAGIAVGGAAALAGITGGGALIARRWSRSINKRIKTQEEARKQAGQQAVPVSVAGAASSSVADPYELVKDEKDKEILAGALQVRKQREAAEAAALAPSAVLRFGTAAHAHVSTAGGPVPPLKLDVIDAGKGSVEVSPAAPVSAASTLRGTAHVGSPPAPSSAVGDHKAVSMVGTVGTAAVVGRTRAALSKKGSGARSLRSASSQSLRADSRHSPR